MNIIIYHIFYYMNMKEDISSFSFNLAINVNYVCPYVNRSNILFNLKKSELLIHSVGYSLFLRNYATGSN